MQESYVWDGPIESHPEYEPTMGRYPRKPERKRRALKIILFLSLLVCALAYVYMVEIAFPVTPEARTMHDRMVRFF